MAVRVNINGINELDITLPGSTSVSTALGVTSLTNINTGYFPPPTRVNSTYIALLSDYQIEATANSFSITLPSAVGIAGKSYSIKNTGTGTITLLAALSQTIDVSVSVLLSQWDNIVIISNGIGWLII
jgi:hypothetical protein